MDDKKIKVNLDITNCKDIMQYCKPKEQLVLFKKFGLQNGKETPLQKIGELYGLTRERVRQIETQGLMRFRRLIIGNERYLKIIEEAKKIIDANGGFLTEADLISKVHSKGISKFTEQEIKMIIVSDFDIYYLKRNKLLFKGFYLDPLYEDLLTEMCQYTTAYFTAKTDAEDLYEYVDKIKEHFSAIHPQIHYLTNNSFYTNFFKSIKGLSMFYGKVGLETFNEVNPKTIKQKILYILRKTNKPLHYQDMAGKITEWFPDKNVKISTVHNELVKNNTMFVNMGLGIYGLREW
jgi:Sigma-70, region 4